MQDLIVINDDDSSRESGAESCSSNTETVVLSSDSSDTPHSEFESRPNNKRQRIQKKKRGDILEPDESALLEKALSVMNHQSDECDVFGQFVASEMRQITDPIHRTAMKRQIMQILMQSGSTINVHERQNNYVPNGHSNFGYNAPPIFHNESMSAHLPISATHQPNTYQVMADINYSSNSNSETTYHYPLLETTTFTNL